MPPLPYSLEATTGPSLGLVVLQTDETIEADFRRLFRDSLRLFVTRIPSAASVTSESLATMEGALPTAAALLPRGITFDAIGYGCTSAAAEIGSAGVARAIAAGAETQAVTEPLSALLAATRALSVTRLAFLSPYVESVSARLRAALAAGGVATPVFGSFEEPEEARVARIDVGSIVQAGRALAAEGSADALFLSCTNLRTLDTIEALEAETALPVLSSNLVLAWHMAALTGLSGACAGPGRLLSPHPAARAAQIS
ncbi:MAG: Asp/Glu racemase [Pseudomonadota bacterium]